MIVARTLASAARSCIQRCRQSRGSATRCSCRQRPDSRAVSVLVTQAVLANRTSEIPGHRDLRVTTSGAKRPDSMFE